MAIYFIGLLALASVLMLRHPLFFIFAITGFFHASVLRPWPLAVAGVAATSILIDTLITGFPWPTTDLWFLRGDHRHPGARDRIRDCPRGAALGAE